MPSLNLPYTFCPWAILSLTLYKATSFLRLLKKRKQRQRSNSVGSQHIIAKHLALQHGFCWWISHSRVIGSVHTGTIFSPALLSAITPKCVHAHQREELYELPAHQYTQANHFHHHSRPPKNCCCDCGSCCWGYPQVQGPPRVITQRKPARKIPKWTGPWASANIGHNP